MEEAAAERVHAEPGDKVVEPDRFVVEGLGGDDHRREEHRLPVGLREHEVCHAEGALQEHDGVHQQLLVELQIDHDDDKEAIDPLGRHALDPGQALALEGPGVRETGLVAGALLARVHVKEDDHAHPHGRDVQRGGLHHRPVPIGGGGGRHAPAAALRALLPVRAGLALEAPELPEALVRLALQVGEEPAELELVHRLLDDGAGPLPRVPREGLGSRRLGCDEHHARGPRGAPQLVDERLAALVVGEEDLADDLVKGDAPVHRDVLLEGP
mmetsp:Transcript_18664/g.62555  ORF Transcript_18664/g.62555 Transcript_18664/m.62555 type:complete len:270 (+) Transcript_18664:470-1279(+)